MVQSAVLGFPRMGRLRDLKKATEACEWLANTRTGKSIGANDNV